MFEKFKVVSNGSGVERVVWIEPWCEEIKIPSGEAIEIRCRAKEDGEIELEERDDVTIVYGWPTSVMSVTSNGKTIRETELVVPGVPPGMSLKGFVKSIFHAP